MTTVLKEVPGRIAVLITAHWGLGVLETQKCAPAFALAGAVLCLSSEKQPSWPGRGEGCHSSGPSWGLSRLWE